MSLLNMWFTSVHNDSLMHRTAPHCTAPHCTVLHCTAMHCKRFPFNKNVAAEVDTATACGSCRHSQAVKTVLYFSAFAANSQVPMACRQNCSMMHCFAECLLNDGESRPHIRLVDEYQLEARLAQVMSFCDELGYTGDSGECDWLQESQQLLMAMRSRTLSMSLAA